MRRMHAHQSSGIRGSLYFVLNGQQGRVLDLGPKGRGLEPHRHHCVVVLEQDTFILA